MAKVRVTELAKEFGVESKAVMDQLKEMGEFVRSASSTIEAPVVRRLKEAFSAGKAQQSHGSKPPELADDDRIFLHDRAATFNNLGVRYAALGLATGALAASEEAVALYRELAEGNPAYLSDLAGSLSNLGVRYADAGRATDALAVTKEAVTLDRRLGHISPSSSERLATALQSRYRGGGSMEDLHQAIRLYQEALDATPAESPDRPAMLSNFQAALASRPGA